MISSKCLSFSKKIFLIRLKIGLFLLSLFCQNTEYLYLCNSIALPTFTNIRREIQLHQRRHNDERPFCRGTQGGHGVRHHLLNKEWSTFSIFFSIVVDPEKGRIRSNPKLLSGSGSGKIILDPDISGSDMNL
jgi:hypothetical protein